jgi:Tfp pilus assembly protein PilF
MSSAKLPGGETELRLNLAESYINNGQFQLALQELLTVEQAAEHTSRFHFDLGMVYLGLDEMEKATAGFAEAVRIDDDYGEAWNNLGKLHESQNRLQEAEHAYRKALSILTYVTPEFPAYNLGKMLMRQGKAKEAEELARKALSRNWRYIPAYRLLSEAFVAQNRMEEAEEVLKSGLEADMGSVATMLALAEQQIRMGKSDEAAEVFEEIIAQHPKSNEAKAARDYLNLFD